MKLYYIKLSLILMVSINLSTASTTESPTMTKGTVLQARRTTIGMNPNSTVIPRTTPPGTTRRFQLTHTTPGLTSTGTEEPSRNSPGPVQSTMSNVNQITGRRTMPPTNSEGPTTQILSETSEEEPDTDSDELELWFTGINFQREGHVRLTWEAQPTAKTVNATYTLQCNDTKGEIERSKMSSKVSLKAGQRYECCITVSETKGTEEDDTEECITITTPPPMQPCPPMPPPMPERQTDLTIGGAASLGVTLALFVVMVIVWVIIGVVMCRRSSKSVSFSPSSYEVQYNNAHQQLQSPAVPARNFGMQEGPVPQPSTSYNTLGPMYELIPDPSYEHINQGPAGKINRSNGNSNLEEQMVTRKSHDPQYHVLEQSTHAKEGTSHDLQGNPSIVKDDTKDHTYHVLENSRKAEGHQKLDNESTNEQATIMEDSHTSGGKNRTDLHKIQEASDEHTYPQKQSTVGEAQDYEIPTCSIPTK